MKVQIGNKVYHSENEPIMITFEGDDKKNIINMPLEADRYCIYPSNTWSFYIADEI